MVAEKRENLTLPEKVFVEEYLSNGFVAAQAYRVAYPNSNSVNNSYRVIKRDRVKNEIQRRLNEEFGDAEFFTAKILGKLHNIAFADKTDEYYSATSQLKAIELLQKQLGLQIKNIKNEITSKEFQINILPKDEIGQ